jgi:phthalate 4,5-dioxygenase oxygenase subunit
MLTKEQNDLLTQTGPGTPMGELMRRYWQPVALSEELLMNGDPLHVRILGEDLVLFRDDQGRPGLLELHCCHRGADLSYGRVENGGLRCLYHGWLFDVCGNCLEQPGAPAGSQFYKKVKQPSYPCKEAGGLIFTYLGSGEPSVFPAYEFLTVSSGQRAAFKLLQECNYLQGNEGNLDQVHLSFLHRVSPEVKKGRLMKNAVPGSKAAPHKLLATDVSPAIKVEETSFGLREYVIRKAPEGQYLKVENFIYPNLASFPGVMTGRDGYNVNWHVPIDDTSHWKYMIAFSRSLPVDQEDVRNELFEDDLSADYRFKRNKENRYKQDRSTMKNNLSFAGMGGSFAGHDAWATESQGKIQDRTVEHLGYEDKSVSVMRKLLFRALETIKEGKEAPHVIRDANLNAFPELVVLSEVVPEGTDEKAYLQKIVDERKEKMIQSK